MLKHFKLALIACLCAAAALFAVACSSTSASSASSEPEEQPEASDQVDMIERVEVPDDPFYVLVVGNDSRYGTAMGADVTRESVGWSDVIILMRVDPTDYRISLVTMPRDVGIVLGDEHHKLNASYHYQGMDSLVEHVEELTGADIAYTLDLGFLEYSEFIDAMDGVTVDIPFDMTMEDAINGGVAALAEGDDQTLMGADALAFARMRNEYADDLDACRQYQNRHALQSIIKKALALPSSDAEKLVRILYPLVTTNMSDSVMLAYVEKFMEHADEVTFQLGTYPYRGGLVEEWNSWQITYDEYTFTAVTEAMEDNDDIQDIVPDPVIEKAEE